MYLQHTMFEFLPTSFIVPINPLFYLLSIILWLIWFMDSAIAYPTYAIVMRAWKTDDDQDDQDDDDDDARESKVDGDVWAS